MSTLKMENLLENWRKKEISNSLNPYHVELRGELYCFKTEYGIEYSVYFLPSVQALFEEYPHWCSDLYEMGFEAQGLPKDPKHDERVADTISWIIDMFFSANENVLLFTCESIDGFDIHRKRLFSQWFFRYQGKEKLTKVDFSGSLEGVTMSSSILYRKDHPFAGRIGNEFLSVYNEVYNS